jgi:hypothetical protein
MSRMPSRIPYPITRIFFDAGLGTVTQFVELLDSN